MVIKNIRWAAPLVVALTILATPVVLFAHARLVRSTPAANATLATAPSELDLFFSEAPELTFTKIELTDPAGHSIALGDPKSLPAMGVRVAISGALAAGKYTVSWRTAASDGHTSSGKFNFIVAKSADSSRAVPAAIAAPAVTTPAVPQPEPKPASNAPIASTQAVTVSAAMRWAELIALLTLIGVVMFRLAVLRTASWDDALVADVNDRAVRFARAVLILFIVATLTRGMAEAELLPTTSGSRLDSLLLLVKLTHWGTAWAIGLVAAAVAFVGFIVASRSISGFIIAAIGLVAVCVSEALTGHSGAVKHHAAAVAADVAHVLGAGGWLGGLTVMILCAMPPLKKLDGRDAAGAGSRLLHAYHGTAVECVTIVVLSAIVAAWTRFPTVSAIWTTPYGQMLLRKTIFVIVVLGFGFYHWRKIVLPEWTDDTAFRFKRTAAFELLFGAVVVAFTALLITQQLP
jgi:methionine-rich copper-binding protein CopC/putative copper export protein